MRSCVSIFGGGSILLLISLLSSCSQSDSVLSDVNDSELPVAAASDSLPLLRFSSIAGLEALTCADLPGYEDQPEWKITQLSYECVDTVQMRALVFDVEVRLTSAVTGRTRSVRLKSEVGPELVSVEYYPDVVVIPAHHNLGHAYYFSVERYRNYSDGSRIGPDEFYDYGHGVDFYPLTSYELAPSGYRPHMIGGNNDLIPFFTSNGYVSPDAEYYSDGTFYIHKAREYTFNSNATIFWMNGKKFSGSDLLPINIISDNEVKKFIGSPERMAMYPRTVTDFNHPKFNLSRGFNMSDPETAEMVSICKNVPDKSPEPFPKDTRNREPGFYLSLHDNELIHPNFEVLQADYGDQYMKNLSFGLYDEALSHHAYLVIDGRIIHYPASMDLTPTGNRITRTKQGSTYKFTRTTTFTGFGEKWEFINDTYIRGVSGVYAEYDFRDLSGIDDYDRAINNALNSRSAEHPEILRTIKTDKLMEIDTRLPGSLRDTPASITIIPSSK